MESSAGRGLQARLSFALVAYLTLLTLPINGKENFSSSLNFAKTGVIHAGIYYPENFLKTSLCVKGNKLLYEYALAKKINHKKILKLLKPALK